PGTPLEQLRDKLLNLIQNSADTITDEDVERARRELLRVREMAATDASRVALQLSEWAAQGDWRLYFRHRDLLEQVKLADVQRVAQTYLKTDNRTVGLFIPTPQPDRAALPATPDVAKLVDGYTGRTKLAAGETFDPTPANIDARTQRSTLPGGIKVAAFPKKTRGETVNIILTLRYGDEERLKPFLGASDFLGSMLVRGTQKLDYAQLKEELTKAAATVTVNHSPGSLTFSVLTKREHLPRALELLHQIVREPAFPAKEFEVLKAEALNRLEKGRTDPASQAQLLMQRTLFPYAKDNLRYIPTLDESIERVQETTLEQVQALYRDLIGASAGELIVVGDCDADQVVQTVQAMLSGWPTPQGYTRVTRPAIPTEKGQTLTIHTPDKANATFIAGFQFALRDDDPDYPALVMANYIVGGGGTLSSRLGDRIRQKDGLSYGVGSVVNADALDGRCVFIIFAICAPQNLGKVDAAVKEELERFLKEGVTAEELDKAKQAYLQAQKVARSQDRVLPRLLAENTYVGRTMAYQADLEEKIAGLTPEQVVAAFRKHVDTNRLIIIHAGDQEKK
ncbi:MAG TPA: insulinase family protein, partial [Gemmatales bacterium]|nr:insulinase family protein [Gemmatales bacterium]